MSITMKVYWRKTHLKEVLMVTDISKTPFIGTSEPFIPIREVFIRISFEGDIPTYSITFYERMLTALPSSTNTRCT
jgi:hypothetical protein